MKTFKFTFMLLVLIGTYNFTLILNEETTPEGMVLVKGGTFMMGDSGEDAQEDESPTHKVTLSDFYIDKYEVTMAEFEKFVHATNYVTDAEKNGGVNK